MDNFNSDPKPGRLILPLVLIGMIATTYTFINRVAENNDLELQTETEVVQEEQISNRNVRNIEKNNNPKCLLITKKNEKISRNDRCEATGKKFKNCCGAL